MKNSSPFSWAGFPAGRSIPVLFALAMVLASSCSRNSTAPNGGENPPPATAPVIQPLILSVLPHDSSAFTQGLLFHEGVFYESTGLYGRSEIRKVNPGTGAVLQRRRLGSDFFGEGLTLKDNRLIQLTWLKRRAFVYTPDQFSKVDSFSYSTQGWGLTNDNSRFIMSDGSDKLFFRDDNFRLLGEVAVTLDGKPVAQLNELEYVDGKVYANVWKSDIILEINPADGAVVRVIDCSAIVAQENAAGSQAVLNGIAYHPSRRVFYLTGKLWKHIYEVRLEASPAN